MGVEDGSFFQEAAISVGSYQIGRYYCTSASGVWQDFSLFNAEMSGTGRLSMEHDILPRTRGGPQNSMRLLSLLHEMAHYVHDLSLGACLVADEWRDSSVEVLLDRLRAGPVQCPTAPIEEWADGGDPDIALRLARSLYERGTALVGDEARGGDYRPKALRVSSENMVSPTSLELMEGVVALQAAQSFEQRYRSSDRLHALDNHDLEYLIYLRRHILPESLGDEYRYARELFDDLIGREMGLADYKNDDWPAQYPGSKRCAGDLSFAFVADIALHIPPLWLQDALIRDGKNTVLDFTPSARFLMAVGALRRQGGFAHERADSAAHSMDMRLSNLYRDIFDQVATDEYIKWPTYDQTCGAWLQLFGEKKRHPRANPSAGYIYRMLADRDTNPAAVIMGGTIADPIEICLRLNIPMSQSTNDGFKVVTPFGGLGRSVADQPIIATGQIEFDNIMAYMFVDGDPTYWRDPTNASDVTENAKGFQQETVNRIIVRALQEATFYENALSCPFVDLGCNARTDACRTLRSVDAAPRQRCALRQYFANKAIAVDHLNWEN